ncbi:TIR domain-containing protein [Nitrosomonas oligotropha]|uniref:TIR domain-containing protein n=1 Tax=Nitrosomonas oligotropha TaxID=42354 RepID=A0A2T5I3P1_9PROT|nr:TIR domain-containing protein [Nitrosomonas oligotropha]PTQ78443.1 TIR domain-containing protein [Nitrosomonas oligotropha]
MTTKRFQVALSFPGEYRNYVSQVAEVLAKSLGKDKVFYDQWYTAELAQPDLDVLLQSFYHDRSGLVVPFLCADYERKEWCGLEWRAIRDLIKRRQSKDIMPMRFDNAEIPGFYSIDGYVDLNDLAPQRAAELILQRLQLNQVAISKPAIKIFSDRLPTVKGEFFGREAELKLLNEAWADDGTRIIQFIAPGGTGKTKLLRHWLDHTDNIDALIAWSFYSQGSSEDKQVSASPFFSHAFDKLGSTRSLSSFATEEEKGEHLADLLRQQRCVLVLDGLEPLQHAGKGMRGELKDRAIRQLLRSLAGQNNGLCIITTRIAVHELSDRAHVIAQNLQNLAPDDGV